MARGEINWKRAAPDGVRVQVCARHVGDRWLFYWRARRYDRWEPQESPPLEDWLELLDGVKRRAARRLCRPDEVDRVRRAIAERFPEAEVD